MQDDPDHPDGDGGDAVCWVERVCDACGALGDGPPAPVCSRCGTPRRQEPAEDGG